MSDMSLTRRLLAARAPQHASLSPDGARLLVTTSAVPLGGGAGDSADDIDEITHASVIDVASLVETTVPAMGTTGHSAVWAPDGEALAWLMPADDGDAIAVAPSTDATAPLNTHGCRRWSDRSRPCCRRIVPATRIGRRLASARGHGFAGRVRVAPTAGRAT